MVFRVKILGVGVENLGKDQIQQDERPECDQAAKEKHAADAVHMRVHIVIHEAGPALKRDDLKCREETLCDVVETWHAVEKHLVVQYVVQAHCKATDRVF